jgi:hypothetical protein
VGRDERPRAVPLPGGEAAAGRGQHLPGALDAGRIAPVDRFPGLRVATGKIRAHHVQEALGAQRVGAGADIARDRRDDGEALGERAQVEAGAADHDRPLAPGARGVEHARDLAQPGADRIRHLGRNVSVEGMRRPGERRRVGTRAEHAPALVDLERVGIDDDAVVTLGERERDGGLAARGRPGDQHGQRAGIGRRIIHIISLMRPSAEIGGGRPLGC